MLPFAMDPLYWMLIGPAMLLALWAQVRVSSAYARYSKTPNTTGLTGAQAARIVLSDAGLDAVAIEERPGRLSDHYDPRTRTLRLSSEVFHGRSVAAIGIAAHEAGHAMQDARGYFGLRLRAAMVPMASLGSFVAIPLIFLGAVLDAAGLIAIGLFAFAAIVAFQLVTLPVEFDASARAKRALADSGVVRDEHEAAGVSRVLSAAALTYVAATVAAVAELAYYVLLFSGRRDEA